MKNLKMQLRKTFIFGKSLKIYFPKICAIPLIVVIVMMPLNHILYKSTAGYIHSNFQEKFYHLIYKDNIKLFAEKNEF